MRGGLGYNNTNIVLIHTRTFRYKLYQRAKESLLHSFDGLLVVFTIRYSDFDTLST